MGTPRLVILRSRHIRHIRHTLTSRHVRTSHIHVQKWVVTVQRIGQRRQTRSQRINLRSLSNKTEVTRLQRRTAVARTDRLEKAAEEDSPPAEGTSEEKAEEGAAQETQAQPLEGEAAADGEQQKSEENAS